MTDIDEQIRRGKAAELLLQNETLNLAFQQLEKEAISALKTCHTDELIERRSRLVAVEDMRRRLHAFVTDGNIAQKTVDS